jgi:hypothetical protein
MSWMSEAWRVFRCMPRPVSLRDLVDRAGMSADEAKKCICKLKAAKCISFVRGSARTGRYYELVPDAAPPADTRGKSDKARAALERARRLRHAASRPISQITAARLK